MRYSTLSFFYSIQVSMGRWPRNYTKNVKHFGWSHQNNERKNFSTHFFLLKQILKECCMTPIKLMKQFQKHYFYELFLFLNNWEGVYTREDWILRGSRSSSFCTPQNSSHYMDQRTSDTVLVKSIEMTGTTQLHGVLTPHPLLLSAAKAE